MVIDEDLKTHIVEGERCQQHPRTLSSPVSCDEGSLRAWTPQTRTQRLQPRQRHQQHQRPHLRPPHLPPCPPLSCTHRLLHLVPMNLPQDSPRLPLQQISLRGHQKGRETAAWTTDLQSVWDKLVSSSKMRISSDIFRNTNRRTWLTGYCMVDL